MGTGASGRNAGFLLAGVAESYRQAIQTYGRPRAAEIWAFTVENHRLLRESLKGTHVGYRQAGSDVLPAGALEARTLQESVELLREDGFRAAWRSGRLFSPDDAEVDPTAMVISLARRAGAGALSTAVEVLSVESGASVVRLHTTRGELRAGMAVLATNAWTSTLAPELPISPVRGQMLATGRTSRRVAPRPVYSDRGYIYWRQLPGGEVLLGGFRHQVLHEEVGTDQRPTQRIQQLLDGQLSVLGSTAQVTHRWAGAMAFTPDRLPLIGPVPGRPGVYVCAGYSGHGLGFAHAATRRLADLIQGRSAPPAWSSPGRMVAPGQGGLSGDPRAELS